MVEISTIETVLLANSDDHLAKAEEAKRTGKPLESVGAAPSEIVPRAVAAGVLNEVSKENTAVGRFGATYAAHLDQANPGDSGEEVTKTNEQLAREFDEYAIAFTKARQAEDAKVREQLAQGNFISEAIQEAQNEMARNHKSESPRPPEKGVLEVVQSSLRLINAGEVQNPHEDLKEVAPVPDASEEATRQALITKDMIRAGKEGFAGVSYEKVSDESKHGVNRFLSNADKYDHTDNEPQDFREETSSETAQKMKAAVEDKGENKAATAEAKEQAKASQQKEDSAKSTKASSKKQDESVG